MTTQQIKIAYELSKQVYNRELTLKEAKEKAESAGINANSLNYYCACFRHMLNGTKFTGSISVEVRDYFLSQIFSTYDNRIKRNALDSYKMTNDYNEERSHCTLHANRELLEKYSKETLKHSTA